MRVKVCGITRREDAELAVALGAWAIGFVFWPGSPRYVEPEAARAIGESMPAGVERVGVFADQSATHVAEVAARSGIDTIQLHGQEDPAYAEALGRPVIKALSLAGAEAEGHAWEGALILLDGRDPSRLAEGGRAIDWQGAARVAARRAVVLAGGLTPENVGEAIRIVRPQAVDVSSGVERLPGEKDPARLRAFFASVSAGEGVSR